YEAAGTVVERCCMKVGSAHRNDGEAGTNENFASLIELLRTEENIDVALGGGKSLPGPKQGPAEPRSAELLEERSQHFGYFRRNYALRFLVHLPPDKDCFRTWCNAPATPSPIV